MSNETFEETLELTKEAAALKAEKYRPGPKCKTPPKKIKEIPYSLLSAEHIRDVVNETGLISPFYTSSHRKSRLKKAAYEGRIGEKAFMYRSDSTAHKIFDRQDDKFLKVPKNQIVFVECDLDFKLPEFIALRFNLQIKHVHRGLLLGTGPLVDPGYWGKLCIPLHNLTDEDYYIPRDEGLIWIEFTKTTSPDSAGQNPLGRPPLGINNQEFSEIEDFLVKASKQFGYDPEKRQIPIRSALPTMFEKSEAAAEAAAKEAKKVSKYNFWGAVGGVVTLVSLVGSLLALMWMYKSDVSNMMQTVRSSEVALIQAQTVISNHKVEHQKLNEKIQALEEKINETPAIETVPKPKK